MKYNCSITHPSVSVAPLPLVYFRRYVNCIVPGLLCLHSSPAPEALMSRVYQTSVSICSKHCRHLRKQNLVSIDPVPKHPQVDQQRTVPSSWRSEDARGSPLLSPRLCPIVAQATWPLAFAFHCWNMYRNMYYNCIAYFLSQHLYCSMCWIFHFLPWYSFDFSAGDTGK